jgi:hypothetical protein
MSDPEAKPSEGVCTAPTRIGRHTRGEVSTKHTSTVSFSTTLSQTMGRGRQHQVEHEPQSEPQAAGDKQKMGWSMHHKVVAEDKHRDTDGKAAKVLDELRVERRLVLGRQCIEKVPAKKVEGDGDGGGHKGEGDDAGERQARLVCVGIAEPVRAQQLHAGPLADDIWVCTWDLVLISSKN